MTNEKEPAWLTHKADQLLAKLQHHLNELGAPPSKTLIMLQLTEPPEGATPEQLLAWDRTCDACGKVCVHDFWTGHTTRFLTSGHRVNITFGACEKHKA